MHHRSDGVAGTDSPGAVLLFVLLAYGWTWLWWLPAWVLFDVPQAWRLPMMLIGGFGPALAGVAVVRRFAPGGEDRRFNPWGFIVGTGLALAALALFRLDPYGFVTERLRIPADAPPATLALYGLVAGISGFVIASAVSRRAGVRAFFGSIVPDRRAWRLLIPVLLFLPVLLIVSNALASGIGLEFETPRFRQQPVSVWLPAMLIKLFTVALLTGGNEEHGWRAVMLPLLQRRMNPIFATLIIGVVWELWHLPLVMGGAYGEGSALAVVAGRMPTTVVLAFLLTVLYNVSRGSVFLCVVFHACINSQVSLFGGSMIALAVAAAVVAMLVVRLRLWRRDGAFTVSVAEEPAPAGTAGTATAPSGTST